MPTITSSPEYICRYQSDPVYAPDGTVSSAVIRSFFRQDITIDDQDPFHHSTGELDFDFVAKAASTVTVGDTTYTYGQLIAAMVAVISQERALAMAAADTPPAS